MIINKEIWAFIPARSGSKSLKNKNIKLFMKKPLIAHSILLAKKIKIISQIIFSTDSDKGLREMNSKNAPIKNDTSILSVTVNTRNNTINGIE